MIQFIPDAERTSRHRAYEVEGIVQGSSILPYTSWICRIDDDSYYSP